MRPPPLPQATSKEIEMEMICLTATFTRELEMPYIVCAINLRLCMRSIVKDLRALSRNHMARIYIQVVVLVRLWLP